MATEDEIRPIKCLATIKRNEIAAREFAEFILDIENASRSAGAFAIQRLARELDLPSLVVDAAVYRIWTGADSLFQIDDIGNGSKKIRGQIYIGIVVAVFTVTVGESLSQGWKETKVHQQIVQSIPKIEKYFIELFEEAFAASRRNPYRYPALESRRVAIIRNEEERSIEITSD